MTDSFAAAQASIEKDFGKGALMRMGDKPEMDVRFIPTGCVAIDRALGGGIGLGRVAEIVGPESSGKSTLALHLVKSAQEMGLSVAYIDAEHALDPAYAKDAIGVDIDSMYINQPDNGEQGLEIADRLCKLGKNGLIVIDSVAALTPRAEIEGEMGDTHMGLLARLMSQAMRKITHNAKSNDVAVFFVNQIREKIGVVYGCFSYGTRVTLADGTQEKIGKIVNQRMDVEVLSYDESTDRVIPRRVVGWFDNGRTDEFLQFTVAKGRGNGRSQFGVTPNHLISTPSGWKEARTLRVGDLVNQSSPLLLSEFQYEILMGGLMGDSALSPSKSGYGARYRWGHCAVQSEYSDWKAEAFINIGTSRSVSAAGNVYHDVKALPELSGLRSAVYVDGKKVFDDDYLKRLTPLSLAIWYMDDGSFNLRTEGKQKRTTNGSGRSSICIEAMSPETRVRLQNYLQDVWGISSTLRNSGVRGLAVLTFNKDATSLLHELIAPHVHPSMDYKLLPIYRGRFTGMNPVFKEPENILAPMPILDIRKKPQTHNMNRYDIEIEGTHNYFVDGIMVHNSPETQPGGRALKFYSSQRLDIRRIESLKRGDEIIGARTRVKVIKNKLFPPFRQAEFDIMYGEGISREGSLIDLGLESGAVKRSGAWYSIDGQNVAQGKENLRSYLKDNPEVADKIDKELRASE